MRLKKLHVNSMDAFNKAMDDCRCKVAVDAGANYGDYTATMMEHGFFVHSFEPVPSVYKQLVERHGKRPDCILLNWGLSDVDEIIKDVRVLEAWTIGQPDKVKLSLKPEMKNDAAFDMRTVTLDWYLDEDAVGLIKLDVDGYEFKVLRGAEYTLKTYKPYILCEFGKYVASIGESPKDMVNFILNLGYNVVSMDGENVFSSWSEIEPQYPFDTTFDVMLIPK